MKHQLGSIYSSHFRLLSPQVLLLTAKVRCSQHTVIANTWAIAQRALITASGKKFVEYKAPLRTDFATCVGQAKAGDDYPYYLQFGKGNVAFTVKLPTDTAANPSVITAKSILGARPYVRWAIAD